MTSEEPIKAGTLHGKARRHAPLRELQVELHKNRLVAYHYDRVKETTLAHYTIVNQRVVQLEKLPTDTQFGFTFEGGVEFQSPIKINKVYPDTPAMKSGEVYEGDIIFLLNGVSVWGKSHTDVTKIAKDGGKSMTLHLACLNPREIGSNGESESSVEGERALIAEIPLLMASVCKYERGTALVRSDGFEVVSSNGQHELSLFFNATTADVMSEWISAISDTITKLNKNEVEKWNTWTELEDYEQILHMGTIHELLPANAHYKVWQRKALVVTKGHLNIFSSLPDSVEGWLRPEESYYLHQISVKVMKPPIDERVQSSQQRANSIIVQSGTGKSHIFSFDSHHQLEEWLKGLHDASIAAVIKLKRHSYRGIWNDMSVMFTIDIDEGFLVEDMHHTMLWSKPFSKLKHSCDDGSSQLNLEFGKHGSDAIELLAIKLEDLLHGCVHN
eukprot:Em0005g1091a